MGRPVFWAVPGAGPAHARKPPPPHTHTRARGLICVCLCVCARALVRVRAYARARALARACLRLCLCFCARARARVRVCVRAQEFTAALSAGGYVEAVAYPGLGLDLEVGPRAPLTTQSPHPLPNLQVKADSEQHSSGPGPGPGPRGLDPAPATREGRLPSASGAKRGASHPLQDSQVKASPEHSPAQALALGDLFWLTSSG